MSHSARYIRSLRSASSLPSGSTVLPSRTIPGVRRYVQAVLKTRSDSQAREVAPHYRTATRSARQPQEESEVAEEPDFWGKEERDPQAVAAEGEEQAVVKEDNLRRAAEGWVKRQRAMAGANDRAFVEHLNGVFPELQFPPELARRILTHGSHPTAINGHNAGMSFLGRRVLESYLLLFLQSSKALQPTDNIDAIISRTIGSYTLGDHIGRRWGLGRGMRWTPAAPARRLAEDRQASMVSVGLYKVQGDAVAAVMGGIFHQFGATVAHRVFHTRVLPYLENLPEQFIADAQSICERMGGAEGKLLLDNVTPAAEPVVATN